MKLRNLFLGIISAYALVACGVSNNISFTTTAGNCADGTTNAPYCIAVNIQNNAGGQNFINSSNFPIKSLNLSVTGASNVTYPVSSGSAQDPNNCLGATIGPGGSCTFYMQLTGESIPVGQKQAINVNASYTIDNTLFGGSSQTASSSTTIYQLPSLIAVNSNGRAVNYSASGMSAIYSAESGAIASSVLSSANDNYYGFLYVGTNNGLYLSGNQTFAYSMAESVTNFSNIVISGTTAYPISNSSNYIYSSSIKPVSKIYWSNYATIGSPVSNNTAIIALGRIFVSNAANVTVCNASSTIGCIPEGGSIPSAGKINALGFSSLGTDVNGNALTGLVAGSQSGLFVESGTIGLSSNKWESVILTTTQQAISSNIISIVSDTNQNLYIADTNGAIYKMSTNQGNQASLQTTLPSSQYEQIEAMVYDNAGSVLYVATANGYIWGCINQNNSLSCGTAPVASNIFPGLLFGLNIVTSLSS